jgi:hypothetical protein
MNLFFFPIFTHKSTATEGPVLSPWNSTRKPSIGLQLKWFALAEKYALKFEEQFLLFMTVTYIASKHGHSAVHTCIMVGYDTVVKITVISVRKKE